MIFPPVCGICNKYSKKSLCQECEEKINQIKSITLKKSYQTSDKQEYYDEHLFFFKYQEEIRNIILNYKFNDKSYIVKTITEIIMCEQLENILNKYDVIIPVPISYQRLKTRGYNQSELLVKQVIKKHKIKQFQKDSTCKIIKIQIENLIKIKDVNPQTTMNNREERQENIKNAYKILDKTKVANKNVILVDDVFTTGSTANECSKMLKSAGASSILVITIAKD